MKPFKKAAAFTALPLFALAFFSSCKKEPLNHLTNEESRIYVSNYDTTAGFGGYRTFSIEDSVSIIEDNQSVARKRSDYDSLVIQTTSQQMQSRGYTLVTKEAKPDLAINISRVTNASTGVFSYSDYWDDYDGYYDPYYWGYPGYGYYAPYAVGIYTIRDGALEIDLLDLKNAVNHGNKIQAVWTGLARGEDIFDPGNAVAEVDSLFSQSPYLKTTN
jgi:hypothetical protein